MSQITTRDRFRGCLLGLATGDALGTALEFEDPGTFEPITDMIGGGPFHLEAGQWTDDTSMALCLATSLLKCGLFDPRDQMERYIRWWQQGYLSSSGRCFDIGSTVREALSRFQATDDPYSGSTDTMSAGNGSLMRLAPVPMYFVVDPREAIDRSADSSRTTHGAQEAVDACRYFAGLLVGALRGVDKDKLLSPRHSPITGLWESAMLSAKIAEIADGSFKTKQPPAIKGTGYVVDTLEAALWAFHHTDDFTEGALKVVNLGDDADTTAAVYGQIAGAYYGVASIPSEWRERLTLASQIAGIADSLFDSRFGRTGMVEPKVETDTRPSTREHVTEVGAQMESSSPENPGVVYILSNPAMESYLKIGYTQGTGPQDVIDRMRQLDTTATPLPFDCEYAAVVENYEQVERALHVAFGENRVRPSREFFEGIPPFRVKAVLELLALDDVTPDASVTYDAEELGTTGPIRRRPSFKVSQARVPEGAELQWADNPDKTCTVRFDGRLEWEGKDYSISELTATFKGWKNKYAPYPAQYWLYENQTLQERREQFDAEESGED